MPVLFLENCTWDQIQKLNKDRTVVILPTGSIEQHGLHLPLNTDSYIINEISKKTAKNASSIQKNIYYLILPVLSICRSPHHIDFAGSLTLSSDTFIKTIEEICSNLYLYNFKRIIILNGHGGNIDCLKVAARNIRDKIDILISVISYWSFIKDEICEIRESSNGGICHAGEMETSMMLYLNKDMVNINNIKKEIAKPISNYIQMDLFQKGVFINHNVLDFSNSGVIGVSSAILITTQLPTANAGADLDTAFTNG